MGSDGDHGSAALARVSRYLTPIASREESLSVESDESRAAHDAYAESKNTITGLFWTQGTLVP